jgi:hypothetical protein
MKEYLTKLCMFLFLAAMFSGRTNELGVLIGALTGTVLLWPLYRKVVPAPKRRRVVVLTRMPKSRNRPLRNWPRNSTAKGALR